MSKIIEKNKAMKSNWLMIISVLFLFSGYGQINQYFDSTNKRIYFLQDRDTLFNSEFSLAFTLDYKVDFSNDTSEICLISFERLFGGTSEYNYSIFVFIYDLTEGKLTSNFNFKIGEKTSETHIIFKGIPTVKKETNSWINKLKAFKGDSLIKLAKEIETLIEVG